MKTCRWNIRRAVWILIVLLSCHGNLSDDSLPCVPVQHQGESRSSQTSSEALTSPENVAEQDNNGLHLTSDGIPTLAPSDVSPFSNHKANTEVDEDVSTTSSVKVEEGVEEPLGPLSSSSIPKSDPLVAVASDDGSSPRTSLKDKPLVDDDNGTKSRGNVEEAFSHLPSSRDESVTKDILQSFVMTNRDRRTEVHHQSPEIVAGSSPLSQSSPPPTGSASDEATSQQIVADLENADSTSKQTVPSPEVVTNVDNAAATRDIKESNLAEPPNVVREQQQQSNIGLESDSNELLSGNGALPTEDMPSFSEWAKKQLEEQVKHGQQLPSSSSQQGKQVGKRLRHKNYASVDCGAKVVGANPEAQSTSAVLSHLRDDYMLNPCTAKIWLVIELCESIQVHRLDLANFELYSSSPRKFAVYSSDRFPTRDWIFLGVFEAKDEKNEQNFTLTHHSFSKYIKIEMESHYGSEHFCPLSLVRVFGTSEFEALETEDRREDSAASSSRENNGLFQDDDDDEDLLDAQSSSTQESPNLFGSAKDAVMNMMKKAAEVLRSDKSDSATAKVKVEEDAGGFETVSGHNEEKSCMCLSRLPVVNCGVAVPTSKCKRDYAVTLLSCSYCELLEFMSNRWKSEVQGRFSKRCSSSCEPYVKDCDVGDLDGSLSVISDSGPSICRFFSAILGPARLGALCVLDQLMSNDQHKVLSNSSHCTFSNATLEQPSSTSLSAHPQVPVVTPAVTVMKTASSQAYSMDSLSPHTCDSGDGRIRCLTHGVVSGAKESISTPVIKTGKILTGDDTLGTGESDSSSTLDVSHISPTKTLESGEKFTAPQTRSTEGTGSADCQGADKSDLGTSKIISTDTGCSHYLTDNIKLDDIEDTSSRGQELPGDGTGAEIRIPDSSGVDSGSAVAAGSLPNIEKFEKKDDQQTTQGTRDNASLLQSASESVSGSITTTSHSDRPLPVFDPPVSITSSLTSSDPELVSSDESCSTASVSPGTATASPSVVVSPSSLRADFVASEGSAAISGNGAGKQQQQPSSGMQTNGLVAGGQKESVFVRLSNRIKTLELNMSLSGQYLEELSRRYRKQMEEMQKAFNKTISALNDTARKAYERDLKQQELIMTLQVQLDSLSKVVLNLQEQQESLQSTLVSRHIFLMLVEVVVMAAVFVTCNRSSSSSPSLGQVTTQVSSNQTVRVNSDRSPERHCVVVQESPVSSSASQQLRRNSDSSIKPSATNSTVEEPRERRKSSTDAPKRSEELSSQAWVVKKKLTIDRLPSKEMDHPLKKKKRQRNSNNGVKSQEQGKGPLVRSLSSGVLLPASTQLKGLPPTSSSSSSSVSLNVNSVRKSSSVDASVVSRPGFLVPNVLGNPLRELNNFRIDDLMMNGNSGPQSSTVHTSVNCVSCLPLLKSCSGSRCPLPNLMYGGYTPELPEKRTNATSRSCGHFGLLQQQQQQQPQRPSSHCQNGDDFVLKKELQKVCR